MDCNNLEKTKALLGRAFSGIKYLLDKLLTTRIEIILIFFSGLLSLFASVMCFKSIQLQNVRLLVLGRENSDVIGLTCFLLAILGTCSMFVASAKQADSFRLSFNGFLLLIVALLLGNFVVAVIFSEYKTLVIENLDSGMKEQLNRSAIHRRKSSSLHDLIRAWDAIQFKLSCCGVHSYRDYVSLWPPSTMIEKIIPSSCCSAVNFASMMSLDGVKQCYIDASIEAVTSQFLHTEGCLGPLQRWLVRLINRMTYFIYVTTCFQGAAILYLSYLGYKESLKR